MKKLSTKNRGVRALIVTGIAGASIVASGLTGSIAESRPLQTYYPCYDYTDKVSRYIDCTPDTRPEPTTTSTTAVVTTTTAAVTTTTEAPSETTTTVARPTTTMAPGSTTTAPSGVAGGGATPGRPAAARPIAAQASYAG